MQQLSGLDASFLAMETANTTGHVGGLSLLDPSDAPEPLTLARLTAVMAERMPLVPVLRRKLPPAEPFRPAAAPALPALAVKAAARLAWRPVQTVRITNELVRFLPTLAPAVNTLVGGMLGLNRGDGSVIVTRPGRAPATPFNRPITPHRRFAFRSVSLDTVKAVKNVFGVSVNDVVMAMCAGALRRWLLDRDALPDQPLVAMIPVSVRDPASKGALGNRVSAMLAPLPTSVTDPGLRLESVHSASKVD